METVAVKESPGQPADPRWRAFKPTSAGHRVVADVHNQVWPDHPLTADEVAFRDRRGGTAFFERWVAHEGEEVAATATWGRAFWSTNERLHFLNVAVLPAHRGKGLARSMLHYVNACLLPGTPVLAETQEDQPDALEVLRRYRFGRCLRIPRSALNVRTFALDRQRAALRRVEASKIRICSFADLEPELEASQRRLWRCVVDVARDIPYNEPLQERPFELFRESLYGPSSCWAGTFVAIAEDGTWVGVSNLLRVGSASGKMNTGITGVLRSHRRMGVARALKVRAIQWAMEQGVARIGTENEENNPMLDLNIELGFRVAPASVEFRRALGEPLE